ncbi:homoserine dehydrogenase [Desulfurispirillum indicum]|uniref:Homoserine dehydrogenase n=1 Tax=Desulfurispirillum indicum (strain ATCC BAA-1389 / DSM 22839 / S5) TaxID=653733 RepID=E6W296_DESIS|nr:homoserine dehydrogenase [Desulfurispirillum indicum]ADU65554.1 homoserine dehydrogenase [Desulfurispirillum indicum S5]UCZ57614.1 homoserine dehydrogenase [Desulfurispirillum indicum]
MKQVNVGLLGYGVVGKGIADILEANHQLIAQRTGVDIRVTKALVKDLDEVQEKPPHIEITVDPYAIFDDSSIDIVVEVMGGYEPARTFSIEAMKRGKHVVTANKACIAAHYCDLLAAAQENGVSYLFEGSVAGGIPIVRAIRDSLTANNVRSISGIINGTANYILSKMTDEKISFYEALAQAQKLGYAEVDPTFDIEGIDASHKIFILALLSWGVELDFNAIYTEGISNISPIDIELARELNNKIKLLAIAKECDGDIDIRVHPTMVGEDHPLYSVDGVFNAVYLEGDYLGPAMFYGQGAGRYPTGSAVVSDIIEIARDMACDIAGKRIQPFGYHTLRKARIVSIEEIHSAFYIRFTVKDTVGVLRDISRILSEHGISIASAIQKERGIQADDSVPFVIITHEARGYDILLSIREIERLDFCTEPPVMIRVED